MREMPIRVVVVRPGEAPVVEDLANGLKPMQDLVEGCIEAVPLRPDLDLICNEEGKLKGLVPNRHYRSDTIVGTFFVARADRESGEYISVTDDDVDYVNELFEGA